MVEQAHRIFKGDDLKALQPWLTSYIREANTLATMGLAAIQVHEELPRMDWDTALDVLAGKRPPPKGEQHVELCPKNVLALPMHLRDMANMIEDLIRKTGLEEAPPVWTPKRENP